MSVRLVELIQRRAELKARLDEIAGELEALDRVLFARMQKLAEAVEGAGGNLSMAAFENKKNELERMRASLREMKTLHVTPPIGRLPTVDTNASGGMFDTHCSVYRMPMEDLPHLNSGGARSRTDLDDLASGESLRGLVPAVTAILEDAGRPMKTAAIYRALLKRGVVVPGKVPTNNLSAHLSYNRKTFVSTSDGWALRSPPLITRRSMTPET